jgi:ergothioneine biosynthesis protein EgtB
MSTASPIARRESRQLLDRYRAVRAATVRICQPLSPEDCQVQSMPDASPVKWHLAHTTWFFETFVLARDSAYRSVNGQFSYLFNSYYEAVGARHPRPQRGLITRPTLNEVFEYRKRVDDHVERLLAQAAAAQCKDLHAVVTLGLHHEQQHQELILTDIRHALSQNPLRPAFRAESTNAATTSNFAGGCSPAVHPCEWIRYSAGLRLIGHAGEGFAFDNEGPRHRVWLEAYELAAGLVTCGEFLAFMADDGYRRPEFWLSDGWAVCQAQGWSAPLYWEEDGERWRIFTLAGMRPVEACVPVSNVSYYEADAFARWAGARLPTEEEWEAAAGEIPTADGPDEPPLVPMASHDDGLRQLDRDVWQWTASPYAAYPGFAPPTGALGEYNGKFMCNQFVLRGGSCATPRSHLRRTYRNFFRPDARWQFTGLRLARDQ